MNTEEQDKFLNDFDLIQIHPQVQQKHVDFLKTIDSDNQSKAVRIVFDNYMKRGRVMKLERHLLFLMVLLILVLGLLQIVIL